MGTLRDITQGDDRGIPISEGREEKGYVRFTTPDGGELRLSRASHHYGEGEQIKIEDMRYGEPTVYRLKYRTGGYQHGLTGLGTETTEEIAQAVRHELTDLALGVSRPDNSGGGSGDENEEIVRRMNNKEAERMPDSVHLKLRFGDPSLESIHFSGGSGDLFESFGSVTEALRTATDRKIVILPEVAETK